MNDYDLKILTSYDQGFIGHRPGHGLVYLCYKNLLLNFTVDEFLAFRNMTKALDANQQTHSFPDGSQRVILQTPYEGTNFTFLKDEIHVLIDALDEAYYMREIYSLIGNHK